MGRLWYTCKAFLFVSAGRIASFERETNCFNYLSVAVCKMCGQYDERTMIIQKEKERLVAQRMRLIKKEQELIKNDRIIEVIKTVLHRRSLQRANKIYRSDSLPLAKFTDVTPLSFGIETLGGIFTRLISRNTTIPTKKSQVFSTGADYQMQVGIKVFQGERVMASDNKFLGEFVLAGIPLAPRGMPQIEVTFDIDANGLLTVTAKDRTTAKQQQITIRSSGGLSDYEVNLMVKDAELNAQMDQEKKKLIDIRNSAYDTIYSAEKRLRDHREKIPAEVASEIETAVSDLRTAMAGHEDSEEVKAQLEAANKAVSKIR